MSSNQDKTPISKRSYYLIALIGSIFVLIIAIVFFNFSSKSTTTVTSEDQKPIQTIENDFDKIENGIHVRTGFIEGEGLDLVVQNCTSCHSAKIVIQNRMSKEKWLGTIRWMQESQNLWDLGVNEEPILNYLSTYYAPDSIGRRANLTNVEWYQLKD